MSDTLPVHVNRDGAHAVEVDPAFEATGSFAVVLHNHGAPTHVHLRLGDGLGRVASLAATNHYVESGDAKRVTVAVETDRRPVEGDLEILTGFGSESATVAVDLVEPAVAEDAVRVDESLAEPAAGDDADGADAPVLPPGLVEHGAVLALAGLAVLLAVAAVLVSDAPAVLVGVLAVAVGVGVAVAVLRRPG